MAYNKNDFLFIIKPFHSSNYWLGVVIILKCNFWSTSVIKEILIQRLQFKPSPHPTLRWIDWNIPEVYRRSSQIHAQAQVHECRRQKQGRKQQPVSFVHAVTQTRTMFSIQISLQVRNVMKDTLDCHFLRLWCLCKYAALARSCDPDLSHLRTRDAKMNCLYNSMWPCDEWFGFWPTTAEVIQSRKYTLC